MAKKEGRPLGQIVGRTLRRWREAHGFSQDRLARLLRIHGLRWTLDQVGAAERGLREDVTLGELIRLSEALNLTAADWFAEDGTIRLGPTTTSAAHVRAWLAGAKTLHLAVSLGLNREVIADAFDAAGLGRFPSDTEVRAASRLGVAVGEVMDAAELLWGRDLDAEREARLVEQGRPATTAHRGRVTRELQEEIREKLPELHGHLRREET